MKHYAAATEVIMAALAMIDSHKGEEGFRLNGDKAVHIVIALENAGLRITKTPVEKAVAPKSNISPQALQIIAGVEGRFFLIGADGEVARLNSSGKANVWAYQTHARGAINAKRRGQRLWDKVAARFVEVA